MTSDTEATTSVRGALAALLAHVHALGTRASYMLRHMSPTPRWRLRGTACPLCGAPLVQSDRHAGEVLTWRRCGGCGMHQYGEMV